MIYRCLRPLLFVIDPETAHNWTFLIMGAASRVPGLIPLVRLLYRYRHPALESEFCGLALDNPVGLAAGFDKDGRALAALFALGFGMIEIGTVTPRKQEGNPRPRLFRLPEDKALINRMGFNSGGAWALADRLTRRRVRGGVVGINLGKQRETPLEDAEVDYLTGLHALYAVADYVAINVSSPNTPGLRELQRRETLDPLLKLIVAERGKLAGIYGRRVPLLLKISPDLSKEDLTGIALSAIEQGIDGLIATNTTLSRENLGSADRGEIGGLSGQPLHAAAIECIAHLYRASDGKLPLIGVGGIGSAEEAYRFIRAGASAVQLYTGLVYRGPRVVRRIKRGLVRLLAADGYSHISQAVGADHRDAAGSGSSLLPPSETGRA